MISNIAPIIVTSFSEYGRHFELSEWENKPKILPKLTISFTFKVSPTKGSVILTSLLHPRKLEKTILVTVVGIDKDVTLLKYLKRSDCISITHSEISILVTSSHSWLTFFIQKC